MNEVIYEIYKNFKGQKGQWQGYVEDHLLPRLHGFELMMASYTMAHLKLGITLKERGFDQKDERLSVWLTNSLEQSVHEVPNLFNRWLTDESNQAAKIKTDLPIMVVLGNPPYSVSSSNKGEWIQDLIKDYKKDLDEKNIQPLSDDYIKFIRYAEHFIEENGSGVVAMITNNSFIDGIIHRQMRKHLLETFDDIYILDLHGNSKKKEKSPDGSKDENVFNIMQGVSISICVRKESEKSGLGNVYHAELFGKREDKFETLNQSSHGGIKWNRLMYTEPNYFFTEKDFGLSDFYDSGIELENLFGVSGVGIVTSRDGFLIDDNEKALEERYREILDVNLSDTDFEEKYNLQTKYFNPAKARSASKISRDSKIVKCFYRPFDFRYILYDRNFLERGRFDVMKNMTSGANLALVLSKQSTRDVIDNIQVANSVIELKFNSHDRNSSIFPLYLYADDGSKVPNLKKEIAEKIENMVGKVEPEDIFDYIYSVLHSPNYREKYKEFLKIDFPRVPYPTNKDTFFKLVERGRELRVLHLLESPKS